MAIHWIGEFALFLTQNLAEILIALAIIMAGYLSYKLFFYYRHRKDNLVPGFRNQPWKFTDKTINFYGKVEYILKDHFSEKLKRKITDKYRTITNNDDKAFRYIHQRFLVSSPQLRPGERLMVHHNVEFGKVNVKKGKWVHLQGKYAHSVSSKRTLFGRKKTYYGRLHYTHEPKGYIKVLPSKPQALGIRPVVVVERNAQNE
jgi:hypothetical protein